jgi:hypothetical protein
VYRGIIALAETQKTISDEDLTKVVEAVRNAPRPEGENTHGEHEKLGCGRTV